MDINLWLKNGCEYNTGVAIYGALKSHKPNLLRLFLKKKNQANSKKLKYELSKFIEVAPSSKPITNVINSAPKHVSTISQTSSKGSFYYLKELHIDLHPLAIKQRNDYQKAISLHTKMVSLHAQETGEALKLALLIEDLFDAIETTQKVLMHYVKHKVVLNIKPRQYADYTGGQLADARRNKRTSITKYKNKIKLLKSNTAGNGSKSSNVKKVIALQKAEKKLLEHELDLQQLNALINEL